MGAVQPLGGLRGQQRRQVTLAAPGQQAIVRRIAAENAACWRPVASRPGSSSSRSGRVVTTPPFGMRHQFGALAAVTWVFLSGATPSDEVGSTITMVSVEPSGHTTWKVLPAGNDENGMPLCAR